MESDDPLRVAARSAGGSFARRESAQADSRLAQYGLPEAVRSASIALRPYNPAQKAQVFGRYLGGEA